MITERESMTLNESSVPALGVEERSDEAPRAGRARPTPDPEVVAKLELIRIRGHLTLWGGGIHHAEIKTAVRAGVPAPDG